jgi:hypothetical protein
MKCAAIIGGLLAISVLLSPSRAFAFSVPERLEFDLRWYGIKGGSSRMEVRREGKGGFLILSTTRSADWVSVFYPVRDRVESRLEKGLPVKYHLRLREGKRRKDREVLFMRALKKALYIDHLEGKRKEFDVPDGVHDPLSALYHARLQDLRVGEPVFVPVFDSKRVWNVKVEVLRKERVRVPAGTFDTILIKPLLKSEGIFSRKGDIYIWLTDDEKRVPVKVRSKVKIGSVTAELTGGDY